MNKRYIVTPWHGETVSLFHVVDTWADNQPYIVCTYRQRPKADREAGYLNAVMPS